MLAAGRLDCIRSVYPTAAGGLVRSAAGGDEAGTCRARPLQSGGGGVLSPLHCPSCCLVSSTDHVTLLATVPRSLPVSFTALSLCLLMSVCCSRGKRDASVPNRYVNLGVQPFLPDMNLPRRSFTAPHHQWNCRDVTIFALCALLSRSLSVKSNQTVSAICTARHAIYIVRRACSPPPI